MKHWLHARTRGSIIIMLMAFCLTATHEVAARRQDQPTEPDYTRGEELDDPWEIKFSALGPIGAIGNVWAECRGPGAAEFRPKLEAALKEPAPELISIKPYIEKVDARPFYTIELKNNRPFLTNKHK